MLFWVLPCFFFTADHRSQWGPGPSEDRAGCDISGDSLLRLAGADHYTILTVEMSCWQKLAGGFKRFLFSIIYGIILPIDFHIFHDG